MEFKQILQTNQTSELWQQYEHSPVLHKIPGAPEFIAKVMQDSHREKFVAVGGPPGAGKETFIGQVLYEIEDARMHPENYSFFIPENLEIKHLSYAEALREARRRGLITSIPDNTDPLNERKIVSDFINILIEEFYRNNPDNHPKLLFYEAVMVTYPEEDIGAEPLLKQQADYQAQQQKTINTESTSIANLGPNRKVFAAFLAPDLELLEDISYSLRNELYTAINEEDVKNRFEAYGTRFEGNAGDQATIDILNTSWAGPQKFQDILNTIKQLILTTKFHFKAVLPTEDFEPFLQTIERKSIDREELDRIFDEHPEYFLYAQLALYFIFAIIEMGIPEENVFIGLNKHLESDGYHLNPYYRRLVKQHELSLSLANS